MSDNPREAVERAVVDTHCHLFLLSEEPAAAVEAANAAGVDSLVCVGIDPESSRRSAELAETFRGVFATAGVHPHTAAGLDDAAGGGGAGGPPPPPPRGGGGRGGGPHKETLS